VSHFGNYEVVYGALGSVIVLLLWIWISALAVLHAARRSTR
jgi:membrane protein